MRKLKLAAERYPKVRQLVIAGGVAANQRFRTLLQQDFSLQVVAHRLVIVRITVP